MSATAKFYTGLAIVLTIIIAVSFAVGYRAGFSHAMRALPTSHGVHHVMVPPAATP